MKYNLHAIFGTEGHTMVNGHACGFYGVRLHYVMDKTNPIIYCIRLPVRPSKKAVISHFSLDRACENFYILQSKTTGKERRYPVFY
jgi:hypothetical protein